MTLQPDSAFFHTIAGGLAAHVDDQYGEFLLSDVSALAGFREKAHCRRSLQGAKGTD